MNKENTFNKSGLTRDVLKSTQRTATSWTTSRIFVGDEMHKPIVAQGGGRNLVALESV